MGEVTTTESVVEQLLDEGLDLYGRGREAEAARCWQQVLAIAPGERRAVDYLIAAGIDPVVPKKRAPEAPPASERRTVPVHAEEPQSGVDRAALVALIEAERYEEALQMLHGARSRRPGDASISRAIGQLKDRLIARWSREIGGLDQVPFLVTWRAQGIELSGEQRHVQRMVDGVATYGDILAASQLGRFETYQLFIVLQRRGALGVRGAEPSSRGSAPPSEPPPTRRSSVRGSALPPAPSAPTPAPPPAREPPPSAAGEGYDACFEQATDAYLRGELDGAVALYEACLRARPGDAVATHNLQKLRARIAAR